jgi:hypothetical protein
MNKARAIAAELDPQSRSILRRFAFLMCFFLFWAAFIGIRDPLPVFLVMTFAAAVVEIGMAIYRRETIVSSSLGRWDLAAALVGLHSLARAFA